MEKPNKLTGGDESVNVTYSAERTNLHDFGYTRAGNVQGDPEVYASYLERILNGDLVDEHYKGLSEKEKAAKQEKIKELESFLDDTRKNNSKYEQEIKVKEKQIEEHRAELLHIREKRATDPEELTYTSFSGMKFSINVFFLLLLSLYLFFFYISIAYKALYVDFEAIAGQIEEGIVSVSIMPQPYELLQALQYNFLLFLVPFVFYAFGWAFHIILDMKHKWRLVFLSFLIAVAFFVDLLLALTIHNNTELAKEMMGLTVRSWSKDPTFYIVLSLGFFVYILWSILLDSFFREWRKRLSTLNLKRIIKHLKQDIKMLEDKILPIELVRNEINILFDEVNTYVKGNVKGYIDQFTTGWISYLSPDNMKDKKVKCLAIRDNFVQKHDIQAGIVKVVRPVKKFKI